MQSHTRKTLYTEHAVQHGRCLDTKERNGDRLCCLRPLTAIKDFNCLFHISVYAVFMLTTGKAYSREAGQQSRRRRIRIKARELK